MFKILSSKTTVGLEQEAEKYDISLLGSLTISNGHYYLGILGVPKVKPKEPEVILSVPKETKLPATKKRSKRIT